MNDANGYAGATEECDLVMKGGITSGVVYPRAACHLAKRYRFRQLGGASAGAIAAAFVAAAELGRAKPAPAGFVGLDAIPDALGSDLATLFQPSRRTAPAYRVLTTWIEPGWGTVRKLATTLLLIVRFAPVVVAVTFALAMLPGALVAGALAESHDWWEPHWSWLVWVLGALVVAEVAGAVRLALKAKTAMEGQGFGLCNGHTRTDPDHLPLTDWMAQRLDELAGLAPGAGPLRFEHLWGTGPDRTIDLQVMTTCLTLRRPYRFPFVARTFFVCRSCSTEYFPAEVVNALFTSDGAASPAETWTCARHPGERVHHLPPAGQIPVVVAARMSLSFPGLLSAAPLQYVDFSRPREKRKAMTAWFSDGGISSNFPMHFFDQLWPRRPTFGINLQPIDPDHPQMTWRPASTRHGVLPRAHRIDSLFDFVGSILDTMQNWNDTTQLALPGFRDRVAELRTTEDEGGMNLKMKPETIRAIANRGAEAAAEFDTFDFDLHRWIRYRVAMNLLDETLTRMHQRYAGLPGQLGYKAFIAQYGANPPNYDVGNPSADARATETLMATVDAWIADGHPATQGSTPDPKPVLRLVPPQ